MKWRIVQKFVSTSRAPVKIEWLGISWPYLLTKIKIAAKIYIKLTKFELLKVLHLIIYHIAGCQKNKLFSVVWLQCKVWTQTFFSHRDNKLKLILHQLKPYMISTHKLKFNNSFERDINNLRIYFSLHL